MSYSDFISSTLQAASQIATEKFGNVTGTTKTGDNNQVLTEADLAIGQFTIAEIKKHYPDYNIIDEEAGVIDNGSTFTWVVDPIDGTSNFANGIPTYGIMIGLLERDLPIAGGVSLPFFHEIITAEKDKGTFLKGEKIHTSTETNLMKCLVAYGIDGHQEDPSLTHKETKTLGEIILSIRNLRSSNSTYDIVQVAKGSYGGMLNRTSKIWDNVAQQIIIEEAGGLYTDFFGKKIDYSDPLTKGKTNFTFCAASPELHRQLQEIIHKNE
jgi:myo-inositol-1(or 4)-monophosphatase